MPKQENGILNLKIYEIICFSKGQVNAQQTVSELHLLELQITCSYSCIQKVILIQILSNPRVCFFSSCKT